MGYDPDIESITAQFPHLRMIKVPRKGTQEIQDDFEGSWQAATPETALGFSAVGFLFGRTIHEAVRIPVGLIQCSWGGSAAEAWMERGVLEADDRFEPYMARWREREASYDFAAIMAKWEEQHAAWQAESERLKAEGQPVPSEPAKPRNTLEGQQRPGNLYAGMLKPIIGYGMRGVIWYQGESNASRAWEYRSVFPLLIERWRADWGQGDFPFYWVQLADFKEEKPEPSESDWAELRESQTLTLALPNTGQAVIWDIGEGRDIHPRNKLGVARRLARHALARDYGFDIVHRSPTFREQEVKDGTLVLRFDDVGKGLYAFDRKEVVGFAIAGADRQWKWAEAKLDGSDTIVLSHPEIPEPVAARYAWADNPVANLFSREGLPVTPFRTDDWPLTTQPQPEAQPAE